MYVEGSDQNLGIVDVVETAPAEFCAPQAALGAGVDTEEAQREAETYLDENFLGMSDRRITEVTDSDAPSGPGAQDNELSTSEADESARQPSEGGEGGDGGGNDPPQESAGEEDKGEPQTYDEANAQLASITDKYIERYAALRGETAGYQQAVDDSLDRAVALATEDNEGRPPQESAVLNYVAADLPGRMGADNFEQFRELFSEVRSLADQREAVDAKRNELALSEHADEINRLARDVDWDKIAAMTLQQSGGAPSSFGNTWFTVRTKADPEGAAVYLERARRERTLLEQGGYLRSDDTPPDPDDVPKHLEPWLPKEGDKLVAALDDWERLTRAATSYMSKERADHAALKINATCLDLVNAKTDLSVRGSYGANDQGLPQEVVDAFRRQIGRKLEQLDADEAAKMRELRVQGPVHIKGGELFRQALSADPHEWVAERLGTAHPTFQRGLLSIEFDKFGERRDDDGKDRKLSGHYDNWERKVTLNADPLFEDDKAYYASLADDPEGAERKVQAKSLEVMEETLSHELNHHLHNHELPLSWLREWQAVVENNPPTAVSEYVKDCQSSKNKSAEQEDLADSGRLYWRHPLELLSKGEGGVARFLKLHDLFRVDSDENIQNIIRNIRGNIAEEE